MHLRRSHILPLLLLPLLACGGPDSRSPREPPPVTPQQQPVAAPRAEQELPTLTELVDSVKSAVINVEVTARTSEPEVGPSPDDAEDPFGRFFGGPHQPPRELFRQGVGSGFIVSADGVALTNNHVVEGAVSIRVKLEDGRQFDGEILGQDALTDLAVIKIKRGKDSAELPFVEFGDSDALKVGEWVVAIGNPFGLASSVSAGIISAKARIIGAGPYDDFLQTDAAINPGNSGGPLFNLEGKVVGINTAIVGSGTGVGFATPANLAKALLPQLQSEGAVTRGWLGVAIQDLTPDLARALDVPSEKGALLADVTLRGPGYEAGLEAGDVVLELDGEPITSAADLSRGIAFKKPGARAALTLVRDGDRREVKVKVGTRPDLDGMAAGRPGPADDTPQPSLKLGLVVRDVPPELAQSHGLPAGPIVAAVEPGSPAAKAGLEPGMSILEVDREPVATAAEFARAAHQARSGSVLLLRVQTLEGKVMRALPVP